MNRRTISGAWSYLGLASLALVALGACTEGWSGSGASSHVEAREIESSPLVDVSRSIIQRGPRIETAFAESSPPLRDIPDRGALTEEEEENDHPVRRLRPLATSPTPSPFRADAFLQTALPFASMPAQIVGFTSQGYTNDAATMGGTPPDTNGAVGPNHFVQAVNTAIAVWDKTGHVLKASTAMMDLWKGYVGTNSGNGCATHNDGDPVVVYDQLADRWLLTQFSLPNANGAPNFQCVAVSKTADPTGAYWLYDFSYNGFNDYGKVGIWPDAYYATFNMFTNGAQGDSDFCAWDRVSMLGGQPAQQHCFQQGSNVSGALPVSLDGKVPPPRGEPGFFLQLSDTSSLDLFKMHVDWTTPANSTVTGPTNLKVATYAPMCGNSGTCVPQPSPGNQLDSLADRMMFRLAYRNYGTHESLVVNHSVDVTGAAGGVRWYEIRSPDGTPVVTQQGTYAPNDGSYRWMGSVAEDQAEGFVLGFSISSASSFPSIGWTGRLAGDAANTMAQGEVIIDTGAGVEQGAFSNGNTATRWGDYSNVTVDPVDDCTFWYTQELYPTLPPSPPSLPRTWDTYVASVRFPSCAANDFTLGVSPGTKTIPPGTTGTFAVTTSATKGTAEPIDLVVQDLPSGVTGAFVPAQVTAGAGSTLTLTVAGTAPLTTSPVLFTVIGKAPSAVHPASADVSVGTALADAGSPTDSGGGTDSGGVTGHDSGIAGDSGASSDSGFSATDSGAATDSGGIAFDAAGTEAGSGNGDTGGSSGCGCRTAGERDAPAWPAAVLGGLVLVGALRRIPRPAGGRARTSQRKA